MTKTTTLNISGSTLRNWHTWSERERMTFLDRSTHYTLYSFLQLKLLLDEVSASEMTDIESMLYKRAREKKIEITEILSSKWESPRYGYPYLFIEKIYKEYKGGK